VTVLAGLDIGNSTTEVVLLEAGGGVRPLAARRMPTVGRKGSPESLAAAARLLQEAERSAECRADQVAVAHLHPADTMDVVVRLDAGVPNAVRRIDHASTPAGEGFAAGRLVGITSLAGKPPGDDLIVWVPGDVGFEEAATRLRMALAAGWPITGIVAAGDDAVLISNRLGARLPIVDEADLSGVTPGARVAIEVAPAGEALRQLCDPVAVATALRIPPAELTRVDEDVRRLADLPAAAIVRHLPPAGHPSAGPVLEVEDGAGRWSLSLADPGLADNITYVRPGSVRQLVLSQSPDERRAISACDAHFLDLRRLQDILLTRRDAFVCQSVVVAALSAEPALQVSETLSALLDRPVSTVASEVQAARLGAATTPGVGEAVTVCDLGGGTIDVAAAKGASVTAAGGGEMLTAAVAALLAIPREQAEVAKRGPSVRVLSPYLVEHEDGVRRFLGEPAAPEAVGHLCRAAGLAPIDLGLTAEIAPQEWRAARSFLKLRAIGHDVERCLRVVPASDVLILCGGAALDAEAMRIVSHALRPRGVVVGRANVLGRYGPLYAVATGLVLRLLTPGNG
jgi:hypothetical protein